ncbi:hypothetical protein [Nannocystis pusilla]|uniref:hypothetical protein n=1 Tax=Nannocystis pusilla TaxID=889268 RepID=UPI003B7C67B6
MSGTCAAADDGSSSAAASAPIIVAPTAGLGRVGGSTRRLRNTPNTAITSATRNSTRTPASARFTCGGTSRKLTFCVRSTGPLQRSGTERHDQRGTPGPVCTTVPASYSRSFFCWRWRYSPLRLARFDCTIDDAVCSCCSSSSSSNASFFFIGRPMRPSSPRRRSPPAPSKSPSAWSSVLGLNSSLTATVTSCAGAASIGGAS